MKDEWNILRSQIATANNNLSKVRFLPYVFTEHGVLMLSNVLNSTKAIDMSIQIKELRKLLMLHIENTDYKFSKHEKTIEQIVIALNNLIEQPKKTKTIGFNARDL